MSEIDEIFASKGKPFSLDPQPSTSSTPTSQSSKKKKNKNTVNTAVDQSDSSKSASTGKKRPPPETIVDSSSKMTHSKRFKPDKNTKPNPKTNASRTPKEAEDEATFKDSRGTVPRRTTEEGWLIYKEDELGIGEGGGDTPLCPFDCDCCF